MGKGKLIKGRKKEKKREINYYSFGHCQNDIVVGH
jgi:hypothetical protein